MSRLTDLEERIKTAEAVLSTMKTELEALKNQETEREDLLGRWATHPTFGRGIIISCKPDGDGELRFAYRNSRYTDGVDTCFVRPEHLTFAPVPLTTAQEFENAPDGTIVEMMTEPKDVYVKEGSVWYGTGDDYATSARNLTKARVIRWGDNDH